MIKYIYIDFYILRKLICTIQAGLMRKNLKEEKLLREL